MTQLLRDALKIRTKFAVQRLLSRLLAVDRLPGSKSEPGHRNVRVVHEPLPIRHRPRKSRNLTDAL